MLRAGASTITGLMLTMALTLVAPSPAVAADLSKGRSNAAASTAPETDSTTPAIPVWATDRPIRRPAALPVLYASYAGLQALDFYTTRRALAQGSTEANPLMRTVSGNGMGMLAVKAAAAVGSIYFAERAWKKNRVGAIALMVALNGVSAAVVAHNAHRR